MCGKLLFQGNGVLLPGYGSVVLVWSWWWVRKLRCPICVFIVNTPPHQLQLSIAAAMVCRVADRRQGIVSHCMEADNMAASQTC